MKVKYYKTDKGLLSTDCQFTTNMIGSYCCTEECPYLVNHDKKEQIVDCSHPGRVRSKEIDRLLTLKETAFMLTVGYGTLTQWIKAGEFPKPIRLGGFQRFRESTVRDWLNAQEARANEQ